MFIDRFRYQATKASQVQSRIKMLEKVVPIEVPPERKKIHFDFPTCAKSGRTVLELKHARQAYGDLIVFDNLDLHIERGDRIALVGPNGSGKSTLMRMLSGEEPPDAGQRTEGHNVVMQYFAQDEATRMDPAPTVYETLADGSPLHMVPAIRNILGGFLFSGDDIYKRVRVLSGGERTRLAVARMLLRPSNTLLLDEPTNHLDLDSKEVLLDALAAYGGTLMFVSHDRYFVERLATKIIDVGNGTALVYPGTYAEFLWHKEQQRQETPAQDSGARGHATLRQAQGRPERSRGTSPRTGKSGAETSRHGRPVPDTRARGGASASGAGVDHQGRPVPDTRERGGASASGAGVGPRASREEKKRGDAEARKKSRAVQARRARIEDLEARIAVTEQAIRDLEEAMAAPGFYDDRAAAQPLIDRHQSLMWEVGDLMHQWEQLQSADLAPTADV